MITDSLEKLSDLLFMLDYTKDEAKETNLSYYLNFTENDIFHAYIILTSIALNYSFKQQIITKANVTEKLSSFTKAFETTFGIDCKKEMECELLKKQIDKLLK